MSRTKVFISYSHRDSDWLARVVEHLAALERWKLIAAWSDVQIEIGAEWEGEIDAELTKAKVAVVLVSPSFLASKYVWEKEMPAIVNHTKSGMQLLPLIVRPCAWQLEKDLKDRQVRPTGGRALSLGSDPQIDLDLAAFVYELAARVGHFEPGAATREREKADSFRAGIETARSSLGRAGIDSLDEDPRSSDLIEFPRSWSGMYNGSLSFRLNIVEIDGGLFSGQVEYRDETRRVEGELSTSPADIDNTRRQIRPRDLAVLFSVVFRERTASVEPGDEWIYRALASRQQMVGRCYRNDRDLAAFELESTT